ncbi:MAG: hypothetical protein ABL961_10095 [Vicinamibacterales bacterium]
MPHYLPDLFIGQLATVVGHLGAGARAVPNDDEKLPVRLSVLPDIVGQI